MPRRLALAALAAALLFVLPSAARASTITFANGVLSFTAATGKTNVVQVRGSGTIQRLPASGDNDPIRACRGTASRSTRRRSTRVPG